MISTLIPKTTSAPPDVARLLFFLDVIVTIIMKNRIIYNHNKMSLDTAQCTRFFQNLSRFKVNGGILSMHPRMVPFERALYLEVFGQVLVAPFEF